MEELEYIEQLIEQYGVKANGEDLEELRLLINSNYSPYDPCSGDPELIVPGDECDDSYNSLVELGQPNAIELVSASSTCSDRITQAVTQALEVNRNNLSRYGHISRELSDLVAMVFQWAYYNVSRVNGNRSLLPLPPIVPIEGSAEHDFIQSLVSRATSLVEGHTKPVRLLPIDTSQVRELAKHTSSLLSFNGNTFSVGDGNEANSGILKSAYEEYDTEDNRRRLYDSLVAVVGILEQIYEHTKDMPYRSAVRAPALGELPGLVADITQLAYDVTPQGAEELLRSMMPACGASDINEYGGGASPGDQAVSLDYVGIKDDTPSFLSMKYWLKFSKLVTTVGLLPVYWATGLITPAGPIRLPIVWIPIAVAYAPPTLNVVFITINGLVISPVVWQWRFSPLGNADSYFMVLFRGFNQLIKPNTGNKSAVLYASGIDPGPAASLSAPLIQDDIPKYERLSLDNPLFLSYANQFLAKAVPFMGLA